MHKRYWNIGGAWVARVGKRLGIRVDKRRLGAAGFSDLPERSWGRGSGFGLFGLRGSAEKGGVGGRGWQAEAPAPLFSWRRPMWVVIFGGQLGQILGRLVDFRESAWLATACLAADIEKPRFDLG
jgi:hypothetical protein